VPDVLEVRWWATVYDADRQDVIGEYCIATQAVAAYDAADADRLMREAMADPWAVRTWEDGLGWCVGPDYAALDNGELAAALDAIGAVQA